MLPTLILSLVIFGVESHNSTDDDTCSDLSDAQPVLAGKILPFLSHFIIGPRRALKIWATVFQAIDPLDFMVDIFLLTFFAWGTVPLTDLAYNYYLTKSEKKEFRDTSFYQIADHVSQTFKIAIVVYFVDCVGVLFASVGILLPQEALIGQVTAKILYTLWAANRLQTFKRYLIISYLQVTSEDDLGKASLYDKVVDFFIFFISGIIIMDMLSVKMGLALSSIFAFGGVGTLVFSLASKDLAAQLVNGMSMTVSDKFHVGEYIKMGDGTSGTIVKIGWMDTIIRGGDELTVEIPNSHISSQRVYNITRIKRCQIAQTLRFKYSDVSLIPQICKEIKEEIQNNCPELITDGKRPFRVAMTGLKSDHIAVDLDCHFDIKPVGDVFWENRAKVLQAVLSVVERNEVEFVTTPAWH